MPSSTANESSSSLPVRKRRRPALSCFECRRRKIKCDRESPCSQCKQSGSPTCTYAPRPTRSTTVESRIAPSYHKPTARTPGQVYIPTPATSPSSVSVFQAEGCPRPEDQGPRQAVEGTQNADLVEDLRRRIQSMEDAHAQFKKTTSGQQPPPKGDIRNPPPASGIPTGNLEDLRRRLQSMEDAHANIDPASFPLKGNATPAPQLRGTLSKSRLFGPSHWMSTFGQFDVINGLIGNQQDGQDGNDATAVHLPMTLAIFAGLQKCKSLVKAEKAQRANKISTRPEYKASMPDRNVADHLVHLYLRTFESLYRIVHIPSFESEYSQYWDNPEAASTGFVVKVLLMMSIGTCFHRGPPEEEIRLLSQGREWVHASISWLSGVIDRDCITINGIQIQCLLVLARQIHAVGKNLVWIGVGTLQRTALLMGLHRDPKFFPRMPMLQREIRRRLWATIMELTLQASLDNGLPPMISWDEFDTEAPANLDDDEITETSQTLPPSKPSTVFTQCSSQLTLLQSLRARLECARLINNFRIELPYEEVLRISSDLVKACRQSTSSLQSHRSTSADPSFGPTAFHCNLQENMLRRFVLALHRPFANKGRKDPRYHFSRQACLENALTCATPEEDNDFSRLITIGNGMFSEVYAHGAITLGVEVITQLEEDIETMNVKTNRYKREPLREAIKRLGTLMEKRIEVADTNVKGLVFVNMGIAQIDAMEAGIPPEIPILEAAKKSVDLAYDTLKARFRLANAALNPLVDDVNLEAPMAADIPLPELDFNLLQDTALDLEIPNSWLYTGLDEMNWSYGF